MHGTMHPYGPRVFVFFAIHFALMLYRPLCVPVQAGEKPPRKTRVNVQSLLCLHPRCCNWRRVQSAARTEKRKQRGVASTSGGVESSGGLAIGSTRTFPGVLAAELARSAMVAGPSSGGWSLVWTAGLTESNNGVMFH